MLEYKESFSSSLAREFAAFANSTGGRILLGVRDDGTVAGCEDNNETRSRIEDLARNCDPPVRILMEKVGRVLVVTVRESENKPVQCREGFFWRQGASTQKLTRDEIRNFFQSEGAIRFDMALCPKFRYPKDFDRKKYEAWIRQSHITTHDRVGDVLVNIEAAERSRNRLVFRNAGVLFFAKEVTRFFPQAYVTCLLAKGTDKVNILDRKDFTGGPMSDIEESLRFIERNTKTAYRIEKLRREEIPDYPMRGLREAITNAVMHRDYFESGANVFVEIYSDRIEISNPGGLPKGLSREELGTRSVRRNPLIADLLHRVAFIEKAGTGIRRMLEDAKERHCPEPEFKANGFFTATFWPSTEQVGEQVTPQVTPQVAGQGTGQVTGQVVEQVTVQVGPYARQILELCIREQPLRAIGEAIGIRKRDNVKPHLSALIEAGLLEMTIPDKPKSPKQRYRTTSQGRKVLRQRK